MLPSALHTSTPKTHATSFALRLTSVGPPPVAARLLEPVPSLLVSDVDGASAALELEEWIVTLLKWALLFFVISVVAGILGFTGISAASADLARILFYIFLVIFLVLLVLGLTIFRV
jgi:uncharacterized membrane protein YtjA (UPF0391 family)